MQEFSMPAKSGPKKFGGKNFKWNVPLKHLLQKMHKICRQALHAGAIRQRHKITEPNFSLL
jgi:hypothetical protein